MTIGSKNLIGIGFIGFVIILAFLGMMGSPETSSALTSVGNTDQYFPNKDDTPGVSQIILTPGMEVYWGENDDIGDNVYLASVGDFFNRNTHPLEKHGVKAVMTLICISNGRGVMQLERSNDGRKAIICNISIKDLLEIFTEEEILEADPKMTLEKLKSYDGKFGVGIFEENSQSVTLFIKESKKYLSQVCKYLNNRGYK